uniref:DNA replication complex GINS protein PSF3 n=1 Tax=Meloidogyne incognita TaxID=6306 RepID=A0A914M847_MELIC
MNNFGSNSTSHILDQFPSSNQQHISIFTFGINKQHLVNEDYYDLDSILAMKANVHCVFESGTPLEIFPLIGQKLPEAITEVKTHQTVVPVWLLSAGIGDICRFNLPNSYNKISSDVIAAGSNAGKLEATRIVARQHYFYLLGIFLCRYLNTSEAKRISTTLLDGFTSRIGQIISLAVDTSLKPRDLLDESEKMLFYAIQHAERLQREWVRRELSHSKRRSTKRKFNQECGSFLL